MPDPMKSHDAPRTIRHSSRRIRPREMNDDETTVADVTNDPFEDAFAYDDEGIAERRRDPLRH